MFVTYDEKFSKIVSTSFLPWFACFEMYKVYWVTFTLRKSGLIISSYRTYLDGELCILWRCGGRDDLDALLGRGRKWGRSKKWGKQAPRKVWFVRVQFLDNFRLRDAPIRLPHGRNRTLGHTYEAKRHEEDANDELKSYKLTTYEFLNINPVHLPTFERLRKVQQITQVVYICKFTDRMLLIISYAKPSLQ